MGMLDRWFGGGQDYPPLPADNRAMTEIDGLHDELEALTHKVRERMEIVPGEQTAYIFVGKPPKRFGIAWIHDGKVSSLKELTEAHNLTPIMVDHLLDALSDAYTHASDAPRYSTHIGKKDVVVIPSEALRDEVHHIFEETIH